MPWKRRFGTWKPSSSGVILNFQGASKNLGHSKPPIPQPQPLFRILYPRVSIKASKWSKEFRIINCCFRVLAHVPPEENIQQMCCFCNYWAAQRSQCYRGLSWGPPNHFPYDSLTHGVLSQHRLGFPEEGFCITWTCNSRITCCLTTLSKNLFGARKKHHYSQGNIFDHFVWCCIFICALKTDLM